MPKKKEDRKVTPKPSLYLQQLYKRADELFESLYGTPFTVAECKKILGKGIPSQSNSGYKGYTRTIKEASTRIFKKINHKVNHSGTGGIR